MLPIKAQKKNVSPYESFISSIKSSFKTGLGGFIPLYHACTYLKPALWPHSYFKNTAIVPFDKLPSILSYSRRGLCTTIQKALTTMNIDSTTIQFTNHDFTLMPKRPAESFGNSIMILDSAQLELLSDEEQKNVLCNACASMKSNLMLKKVIAGFATPLITYCGFKCYMYAANKLLDHACLKSEPYPRAHTTLKRIQHVNNSLANSWIAHFLVNTALFYAITHRLEVNACHK